MMVVVIDDRENEVVINKLLLKMGDRRYDERGNAEVKRLQSADYIIGDIGIEAKEINDLWRSILGIGRSRTIVAQLADLVATFERPMLVVYGNQIKVYQRPGKRRTNPRQDIARAYAVIKSFKQELYHRFPTIQFMQVDTMDHFVDWIAQTHKNQAIARRLEAPMHVRRTPRVQTDARIAALAAIPGITETHARAMLEMFGSVPRLLRSKTTQKQLMEIPGIGRSKARLILSLRDQYEVNEDE